MSVVERVNALTQEQRDQAYNDARSRVAGSEPLLGQEPLLDDFVKLSRGKFPKQFIRLNSFLIVMMLLAAFLPSAMRLHEVALDSNGVILAEFSLYVAAACFVIMAETGQIIFSLGSAVVESRLQKLGLWTGSAICMGIALAGNALAMNGHIFDSPMTFAETFAPPVLVFFTSTILKSQMLNSIADHHAAVEEYRAAYRIWRDDYAQRVQEWQSAVVQAEQNPAWGKTLANTLRYALRDANRQSKAVLRELTTEDWKALVNRERRAEEWWSEEEAPQATPSQPTPKLDAGLTPEQKKEVVRSLYRENPNITGLEVEQLTGRSIKKSSAYEYLKAIREEEQDVR